MSKNSNFFGQPIFSQVINLIDRYTITKISKEYGSDHYCKRFDTFQHLITMLYGVLSSCNSLRELCTGIVSYGDKISHCKFDYAPRRSTISDANKRRDYAVFEAIYLDLVDKHLDFLSDSHKPLIAEMRVFAIDSTTISLFQPIFECVGRIANSGKRKGGIKSHQKLDMQAGIPVNVYHSHAREHDSLFIQRQGVMNPGEVGLFDKAYNNYQLFDQWNQQDIYFVTRMKNNAKEELLHEYDLPQATADEVLRDAKIGLNYTDKDTGEKKQVELRLVSYYAPEKKKPYYFLTNLFDLPAEQIANLYKKRWEVELLFKKIKQNFPLQYFYGDNQNAIQIQIWATLIALLLVSVLKKRLTKPWSFSNLISLLQKHLFTYAKFTDFFNNVDAYAKEFVKNKGAPVEYQGKFDF